MKKKFDDSINNINYYNSKNKLVRNVFKYRDGRTMNIIDTSYDKRDSSISLRTSLRIAFSLLGSFFIILILARFFNAYDYVTKTYDTSKLLHFDDIMSLAQSYEKSGTNGYTGFINKIYRFASSEPTGITIIDKVFKFVFDFIGFAISGIWNVFEFLRPIFGLFR